MITITKRMEWDAAHRVMRHESKCRTCHGHRWAAEITCTAPELDSVGRVIDFSVIKSEVGKWIDDFWDHTGILNAQDFDLIDYYDKMSREAGTKSAYLMQGNPTSENIAKELYAVATALLSRHGVTVVEVTIYETPTSRATYRGDERHVEGARGSQGDPPALGGGS